MIEKDPNKNKEYSATDTEARKRAQEEIAADESGGLKALFSKPEIKERFPGVSAAIVMRVYKEAISISQDDSVVALEPYDAIVKGMGDKSLAETVLKANIQGIKTEKALEYAACANEILRRVGAP
jgi:hypothetical protein